MKSSLEKMWRRINNFFSLHSFKSFNKPFIWTVTHYWTGTNDLYRCYILFEMVIFTLIYFYFLLPVRGGGLLLIGDGPSEPSLYRAENIDKTLTVRAGQWGQCRPMRTLNSGSWPIGEEHRERSVLAAHFGLMALSEQKEVFLNGRFMNINPSWK